VYVPHVGRSEKGRNLKDWVGTKRMTEKVIRKPRGYIGKLKGES
jgi:hypothetical protein